jgi:hypothetical protein
MPPLTFTRLRHALATADCGPTFRPLASSSEGTGNLFRSVQVVTAMSRIGLPSITSGQKMLVI